MAEPSENWLTVIGWIGGAGGVALAAFATAYNRARGAARSDVERSPDIVGTAIGAAFMDRSAANALLETRADIRKLVELGEKQADDVEELLKVAKATYEHEGEERVLRRLQREAKGGA